MLANSYQLVTPFLIKRDLDVSYSDKENILWRLQVYLEGYYPYECLLHKKSAGPFIYTIKIAGKNNYIQMHDTNS